MVAQDTPVLEASNGVLAPGSTSTMATPPRSRRIVRPRKTGVMSSETPRYAPSARVRLCCLQNVSMFEPRSCTMSLRLPGPPAVMATIRRSRRRTTTWALHDQRSFFERAARRWSRVGISVPSTTHDSRRSLGRSWVGTAASRDVIVETIRCAADLEIAKLAASSRIVRLVRNAAHAIKMRCASKHDHGWRRRG